MYMLLSAESILLFTADVLVDRQAGHVHLSCLDWSSRRCYIGVKWSTRPGPA